MPRFAVAVAALAGLMTMAPLALAQQRADPPTATPFLTAPLQSLTAPPAPATSAPPSAVSSGGAPSATGRAAANGGAAPERIVQTGRIAYYGKKFAGRRTASGERFDPEAMTMAHRTLPFGTRVRVTNLANGMSVVVRVNDRGPSAPGRIADLSLAAAESIEMIDDGVVEARLEVLRVVSR